jgi:hypothetical protein
VVTYTLELSIAFYSNPVEKNSTSIISILDTVKFVEKEEMAQMLAVLLI